MIQAKKRFTGVRTDDNAQLRASTEPGAVPNGPATRHLAGRKPAVASTLPKPPAQLPSRKGLTLNPSAADDELGPVDHLVVEFPAGRITAEGFSGLIDLVDRRLICVLDLEFVMRGDDGGIRILDVADLSSDPELTVLAGACSGLLDDEDLRTVVDSLQPGTIGAVLIFEHLWVSPMLAGLRASGGRVVSENRVPIEDLLEALDRIEQSAGATSP